MCTAECNSSQHANSSAQPLQLPGLNSQMTSIKLVIVQMFVWPFVYINILMLFTFYRKQAFRTETRYILFAHTLLTDMIFLLLTDLVVILPYSSVLVPVPFCIPLCILMEVLSFCTPLTITAMCVERYVAICMPLRHSAISTTSRTLNVILIIWIASSIKPFVDVIILVETAPEGYFLEPNLCFYEVMTPEHWHRMMRGISYIVIFILILMTECVCYLMIIIAARAASVDRKSAGKGLRTISLHMIQLLLCTSEIISPYIEAFVIEVDVKVYFSVRFFNFITLSVIARAVTPLIYGLRDEKFYTALLCYIRCRPYRISSENQD